MNLPQGHLPSSRKCSFWNLTTQNWSTRGCKLNVTLSNSTSTVCNCDHLTSFSMVMDFMGNVSPNPNQLSAVLTNILLPLSVVSLVLSEVFNSFQKPNQESQEPLVNCQKHRKRVERLRNLSLCAGQLCWLVLPDLATRLPHVPPMLCQASSALTHLVWMLFWSYAGG